MIELHKLTINTAINNCKNENMYYYVSGLATMAYTTGLITLEEMQEYMKQAKAKADYYSLMED